MSSSRHKFFLIHSSMLSLRAFLICLRTSPRFGGATFLQLRYAARDAFKVSSTSVVVSIAHARQSYSRVERKRGRTLRSRGRDLPEDLARRSVDRGLNGACPIENVSQLLRVAPKRGRT